MPETQETFEGLKNHIDQLPIGLMLFNAEKKITSWNKQVVSIFEVSEDELKTSSFGNVTTQVEEIVKSKDTNETEIIGLSRPYKVTRIQADDNNVILMVTESYQEAIGEMSHELRRPITNIKTLTESLLMGAKDDPDIAGKFLNNINGEIDRLTRLVNDLLNISKIRSGKLEVKKEKLDLKVLSEDAIKLIKPNADKKSTTLINEVPDGYEISADPEHIDHVIQNLIENAVKYSPDESTVTIKPGPTPGSFQVDDTGIGIPPEQLPKIFDRFYQVDRTKAKGSSGLGLSIVKNIINLHSGKIEVQSTVGEGSSFIVHLPEN